MSMAGGIGRLLRESTPAECHRSRTWLIAAPIHAGGEPYHSPEPPRSAGRNRSPASPAARRSAIRIASYPAARTPGPVAHADALTCDETEAPRRRQRTALTASTQRNDVARRRNDCPSPNIPLALLSRDFRRPTPAPTAFRTPPRRRCHRAVWTIDGCCAETAQRATRLRRLLVVTRLDPSVHRSAARYASATAAAMVYVWGRGRASRRRQRISGGLDDRDEDEALKNGNFAG
jgi:hypothetical protein